MPTPVDIGLSPLDKFVGSVQLTYGDVVNKTKAVGSAVGRVVGDGAKAVGSGVAEVSGNIAGAVGTGAKAVGNRAKAVGSGVAEVGGNIAGAVGTGAKTVGSGVSTGAREMPELALAVNIVRLLESVRCCCLARNSSETRSRLSCRAT